MAEMPDRSISYFDAIQAIEQMARTVKTLEYPLDQKKIDEIKIDLENAMDRCQTYMKAVEPEDLTDEKERTRYQDIEEAYDFCKRELALLDRQKEATEAEMNAAFRAPEEEAEAPGREKEYDRDEVQDLICKMVLQEMIRKGRSVDETGATVAGPLEKAYAANPGQVLRSICDNTYFRAVTEGMTAHQLRNFAQGDGVRAVAESMLRIAEQKSPLEEEENELYSTLELTPMGFGM